MTDETLMGGDTLISSGVCSPRTSQSSSSEHPPLTSPTGPFPSHTRPSCVLELLARAEFPGQGHQSLQPQLKGHFLSKACCGEEPPWKARALRRPPHCPSAVRPASAGAARVPVPSIGTGQGEPSPGPLPTAPRIVNELMISDTDSRTQDEVTLENQFSLPEILRLSTQEVLSLPVSLGGPGQPRGLV